MTNQHARSLRLLGPVCLALAFAGCAMEPMTMEPPPIEPPPVEPPPIEPPPVEPPPTGQDLEAFLRSLPSWIEVSPPVAEVDEPISEPVMIEDQVGTDETVYHCTSTTYELARNPMDIAMASPDAAVVWPGALLRGDAHLNRGASELLAVSRERRAPMGISLQGGGVLGIPGGVSALIDQPIGSTVREGINQLVVNALDSEVATGAGASSFRSVETYSNRQALLELGFDARYLGASVEAAFSASRAVDQHTLTATYVQRLFTVAVDAPESPADFFASDVTAEDLAGIGVGPDNLPLYIDSVSYGRMLMVSITSTATTEQMEAALSFAYDGVFDASAYAEAELRSTLETATIEVFALGGSNAGVEALIASGELGQYFDGDFAINQVEPISFTVRNLADNRLASVGSTTQYEIETCEEVAAALPVPNHVYRFDGNLRDALGGPSFVASTAIDYAAGIYSSCVALGNDSARITSSPVSRTGEFTVSAWVRPARSDAMMTIVANTSSNKAAGDFQVRLSPGGQLGFFRRTATGTDMHEIVWTATGAVPVGVWTHVTAVYGVGPEAEGVLRIYVNGTLIDGVPSATNYVDLPNTQPGFAIGGAEYFLLAPRWPYYGAIDELMLFDHALSSDEVASHYERFDEYFTP
ncbi:MAG: thiol-activated cytolysin family protein [Sandaracinaceae bacterium]